MHSMWFGRAALAVAMISLAIGAAGIASAQGEETSFQVGDFDRLHIEDAGHAIVTIGSPVAVTVSGTQDLISRVEVEVESNTLEIEFKGDRNGISDTDLVYRITVPSLSQIELDGAASAEVDGVAGKSLEISADDNASLHLSNLSVDHLETKIEDNAIVTVAGSATAQAIEIEDNGSFDALQLESTTIQIEAEGNGHSEVRFSGDLSGEAEDAAVVNYMTETGTVSIRTQNGAKVTELPFVAIGA